MSSSPGQTSLPALVKTMTPTLDPEPYVFGKFPTTSPAAETFQSILLPTAKMLFREDEAWTAILPRSTADREGVDYSFPCRQITLNVHSSLDAVGFLAAITTRLAENLKIGVNPVSGYYHDHLFVAAGKVSAAVQTAAWHLPTADSRVRFQEDEVLAELNKMAAEQQ